MSFVNSVAASLSDDGRTALLEFQLEDGNTVPVSFPTERTCPLLLDMQHVLGTLFTQQRELLKGLDPRLYLPIFPMDVEEIQGGAVQGKPVLSLLLRSKLRLDVGLERSVIRDLIAWLR